MMQKLDAVDRAAILVTLIAALAYGEDLRMIKAVTPGSFGLHVDADIWYTGPECDGASLMSLDHGASTFRLEKRQMRVHDARAHASSLSFDRNGFTLLEHRTDIDFQNKNDVTTRYYPQAAHLVRELTGALDVLVFADLIRSEVRDEGAEPAFSAHVDFCEDTIRRLVRIQRPEQADEYLKKRLISINLWRPITPVQRLPLALCDASTVNRSDMMTIYLSGREAPDGKGDFAGLNLAYNRDHRWYYYPNMHPGEVLAFKLYDSDERFAGLTAHTAFDDPASPADAGRRISHETRTIAVLD